jgi:hypothetical protein
MYAKWFDVKAKGAACSPTAPLGCKLGENTFEDTQGADTGKSGALVFNLPLMAGLGDVWTTMKERIEKSWTAAQAGAVSDATGMATTAFDAAEGIFWTWLTPEDTRKSCDAWIGKVGGVMTW